MKAHLAAIALFAAVGLLLGAIEAYHWVGYATITILVACLYGVTLSLARDYFERRKS